MKHLVLALTILVSSFSYCQKIVPVDYVCDYSYISIADTSAKKYFKPVHYVLIGKDVHAQFVNGNRRYNDSLTYDFEVKHSIHGKEMSDKQERKYDRLFDDLMEDAFKNTRRSFQVEKDFQAKTGKVSMGFQRFPPRHMQVSLKLNWEIKSETDTIAGLRCQKAKTTYGGRNYTAWFCPEIPLNDGPYVFGGLPGLITKITDDENFYAFTLESTNFKPGSRYWDEELFAPFSQELSRKEFVESCERQKKSGRIFGVVEASPEYTLQQKKAAARKFHLLMERLDSTE